MIKKSHKHKIKGNVLITGASRGIGYETSLQFVKKGYRVIGVARSEKGLAELENQSPDGNFVPWQADLGSATKSKKVIREVLAEYPLDGVILNAGFSQNGLFAASKASHWKKEMEINYFSPAMMLQECIHFFKGQGRGHILAVSSLTAQVPFPENASYAASKAAFYNLMRTVKLEESDSPIRFSLVLPGATDTEMAQAFESLLPKAHPRVVAKAIWKCWRKPEFPHVVGPINRFAYNCSRLAPDNFDFLLSKSKNILVRHVKEH